MNPYREPAAEPVRVVPASLRHGEVLGAAAIVTACGAWVSLAARVLLALPAITVLAGVALALVVLGLATFVDRRTRASLMNDPELAGSWPIECARRRRELATRVLLPLVAWIALGLFMGVMRPFVMGST